MNLQTVFRSVGVLLVVFLVASCGGKTKEELLAEADKFMKEGNPSGAIVALKSALEKDQNFFDARYQLAKAYRAAGKLEQAEREMQKVQLMNPSRADLQLETARLLLDMRKYDEALTAVQQYLAGHANDPEALELLGYASLAKDRSGQAEESFLKALAAEPGRASAQLGLARAYVRSGKGSEARKTLEEMLAKDPKNVQASYTLAGVEMADKKRERALEIYRSIAAATPGESEALYRAGLIYVEQGDLEKAGATAEDLIERFPKKGAGSTLKGMVLYYKKNYREAATELQKSVTLQPSSGAYYFLGLSHYNLGENEVALSHFKRLLDANPSFHQARLLTAMLFLKQKRADSAISELKKVIELDPQNAMAHNMLGSAYIAQGMHEEAMRELNKALELDPKLVDAHLKKGIFNLTLGKSAEAEAELKTAVKIAPDVMNTRFLLASYYLRQKNSAKAMSLLKEGLTGKKTDAVLYSSMATILAREKKPAEALAALLKAKETDPDYLPPYFSLGVYYAAQGDYGKALAEYQTVLRKAPQNAAALIQTAATYELQGKESDAFAYYSKAKELKSPIAYMALTNYHLRKKETDKAVALLDELYKMNPNAVEALEAKGKVYLGAKNHRAALAAFEELETKSPGRGMPFIVATYALLKDYTGAIKLLEAKLREKPDSLELRAELAMLASMNNEWDRATEHAQKIINAKPRSAAGYEVLAAVYERRKENDKAIAALKRGLIADPKDLSAALKLGGMYARQKEFGSALAALRDIEKHYPRNAQVLFARGSLLETMGKRSEAVKTYQELIEQDETYLPALNNLAYLYAQGHGSKEQALELAVKAYKLSPGSPEIMDTLGFAYLKNGKRQDALKVLKQAAAQLPENPSVNYHLALALKENGDTAGAIESLQRALKAGEFPEAKEAAALLGQLTAPKR